MHSLTLTLAVKLSSAPLEQYTLHTFRQKTNNYLIAWMDNECNTLNKKKHLHFNKVIIYHFEIIYIHVRERNKLNRIENDINFRLEIMFMAICMHNFKLLFFVFFNNVSEKSIASSFRRYITWFENVCRKTVSYNPYQY